MSELIVPIAQGKQVIPSVWTAKHVAAIAASSLPSAPVISRDDHHVIVPGFDLWDFWPVQNSDGKTADIAGGSLWMALAAPAVGNPVDRHLHARIRLLLLADGHWSDLGQLLPEGLNPGNREWSGSAVLDGADRLTLYFTAAGLAGTEGGWRQRLYQTHATLVIRDQTPWLLNWSAPIESVRSDGHYYVVVDQIDGEPGTVKAFRDPAYFRDPADGASYLLFAASLGTSHHSHNGCVGRARAVDHAPTRWELLPPLIVADGLNNELERPHIVAKNDLYYLFWSTQRSVFAPGGPAGPTGLYGMVAEALEGPYAPLNGTGLVIANPENEPCQAYSWHVLDDLRVTSFVDSACTGGRVVQDGCEARLHFGGTLAPLLQIALEGTKATLVPTELGVL